MSNNFYRSLPPFVIRFALKHESKEQLLLLTALLLLPFNLFDQDLSVVNILLFSTLSLTALLLNRAIVESHSFPRWPKIFLYVHAYGSSILFIGLLFKIQHFPGTAVMMNVGVVSLFASILLLFVPSVQDSMMPRMRHILLRLFIMLTWTLFVLI
jgi:hypothetical protein